MLKRKEILMNAKEKPFLIVLAKETTIQSAPSAVNGKETTYPICFISRHIREVLTRGTLRQDVALVVL